MHWRILGSGLLIFEMPVDRGTLTKSVGNGAARGIEIFEEC